MRNAATLLWERGAFRLAWPMALSAVETFEILKLRTRRAAFDSMKFPHPTKPECRKTKVAGQLTHPLADDVQGERLVVRVASH